LKHFSFQTGVENVMLIRNERPADVAAIYAIHASSFPTDGEAKVVDALRVSGRLSVSLVAELNGDVVGHVAFSPVTVADGAVGVGLGPIAVVERERRKGVGAGLVEEGLAACRLASFGWAVVLGDPAYYARFGFRPASEFWLSDEFRGGAAFQAVELVPGALPVGAGLVRYAREFAALE
jgi:putative acetyltransferase